MLNFSRSMPWKVEWKKNIQQQQANKSNNHGKVWHARPKNQLLASLVVFSSYHQSSPYICYHSTVLQQ